MLLEVLLVGETLLGNSAQHVISLTDFVESLNFLLLMLHPDGLVEVLAILSSCVHSMYLIFLLFPLVDFGLTLDNCTPFVRISLAITRVVPITLLLQCLH